VPLVLVLVLVVVELVAVLMPLDVFVLVPLVLVPLVLVPLVLVRLVLVPEPPPWPAVLAVPLPPQLAAKRTRDTETPRVDLASMRGWSHGSAGA
jgi:hypothetical protein